MVIDYFLAEFEGWRLSLPDGTTSQLLELERPAGVGRAARLDVETATRLVQATIWDSGEVDLVVGDLASGDVLVNEHREVSARLGVRTLLEDVLESVAG